MVAVEVVEQLEPLNLVLLEVQEGRMVGLVDLMPPLVIIKLVVQVQFGSFGPAIPVASPLLIQGICNGIFYSY